MKKILFKILLFTPVLILIIGVNIWADPANLFSSGYENKVAGFIAKGYNVTNINNCDERLLQKQIVSGLAKAPQTIVLGSSRVMLIGSAIIPGMSLMNNGVSGAGLEDVLATYHLYVARNYRPVKVIIGLDAWMLNDSRSNERIGCLWDDYKAMMKLLQLPDTIGMKEGVEYSKWGELISLNYFQQSFRLLWQNDFKSLQPEPTHELLNKNRTLLQDGSITYDEAYRNSSPQVVQDRALQYIQGDVYGLGGFNELSVSKENILVHFIEFLKQQGIQVELLLAPYHPVVFNYLKENKKYDMVMAAETYYKQLAEKEHISLIGSYDPVKCDFKASDFYDGMHCKPEAMKILLSKAAN